MNTSKTSLALGALLCSAAVLSGCGGGGGGGADASQFPEGSKMAEIAGAGKLRVGTQTAYPLIGQQTLDGYDGFDVKIAEAIAEKLGLSADDVEFVPVTTPTREPFLQQGKVDIAVAAYSITEERQKVVDFAGPYLHSPGGLMVQAGNPQGIKAIGDLVGKKLCTPEGGSYEVYLREHKPEVAKSMVLPDSSAKCRDAVLNGTVDASTTDEVILASFVAQSAGKLELVDDNFMDNYYGIGVPQSTDDVFCKWLNETLTGMYEDGTWEKAYDKTLGTVLGEAPEPPKVGSCDESVPK